MADRGGEIRFTFNSNPLVIRAKFESEPVKYEIDGGANQDGSLFRTIKPVGYIAEMTFQDTPANVATDLNWSAIIMGGPYNSSLAELDVGFLHTWAGMVFEGKPRVDHMTGEVTGLKIRAASYTKTTL